MIQSRDRLGRLSDPDFFQLRGRSNEYRDFTFYWQWRTRWR